VPASGVNVTSCPHEEIDLSFMVVTFRCDRKWSVQD
jgi:hypothetical protein